MHWTLLFLIFFLNLNRIINVLRKKKTFVPYLLQNIPPKLVLFLWRWNNNNYRQTFSEDHLYFWSCLQVSFGAGLCLPPYCCSFSVAGLVPFSEYCAWSVTGVVQLLGCGNWSATHSTFWSSFRLPCDRYRSLHHRGPFLIKEDCSPFVI